MRETTAGSSTAGGRILAATRRRRLPQALRLIVAVLVTSGCGGVSHHATAVSPPSGGGGGGGGGGETVEHVDHESPRSTPIGTLDLASPIGLDPVSRRFTCDGTNTSPPLVWGAVPHHTAEIDVFIFSAEPVGAHFVFAWALAGISPRVHKLQPGHTPKGAIVGRNSFGAERYSLCPPPGKAAQYAVFVYAMPRKAPVRRGFDPEVLLERTDEGLATSAGSLVLSHTRA